MPTVRESIRIDRPVEEVFAYATDPAHQTLIASNMTEFELNADRMEKGARASGATRVAGKRVEWTSEITEYHEGQRVEMRSIDAPMEFHITWTYEPDGEGTLVTFEQEAAELGGFFGRLADSAVTKMYSRDVRSNLEALKILLEEG